jgi:TRAP transporter TAXI family solute receptor
VVPSKGATENAALLKRGDIDLGLVSGEVTHELRSAATRESDRLKIISVMYASPGMFAVRADSRYHRISDLKGRPIVWNMHDSGIAVKARYVMEGLGLDMDRDFEPIYPERYMDGPPLVLGGAAAALWGSGFRWPNFVELANAPIGARFVVPDAAEIERIHAKYAFMTPLTVPARLYPGQYDPIETVGSWSFILARADLPDAIGYRLAAALHKAERTGALTKQLTQTTVKDTLSAVSGEMLQPGVVQYYRKAGLLK